MAKTPSAGEDAKQMNSLSHIAGRQAKMALPLWKTT